MSCVWKSSTERQRGSTAILDRSTSHMCLKHQNRLDSMVIKLTRVLM